MDQQETEETDKTEEKADADDSDDEGATDNNTMPLPTANVEQADDAPSAPKPQPEVMVTALYDYEATDTSELSLHKGEVVKVTQKDPSGWWYGQSVDTKKWGFFPVGHIQRAVNI